jgi:hypothetical protein
MNDIILGVALLLGLMAIGQGIKDGLFRLAEVLNLWSKMR